ncbi:hypothetical protein ENLAB_17220 [Enterococcus innesii]|uniref:ATPase AAA-type core domain-containing protein n=1 Tax=Enterococcus innesii TaxID=2839759 RepID=A0ABM7XSW4_9ENTE|nr:AAA family ATPase [Enterococcus innesii]BDG68158.1 hypothetical protein ENLAB_17220 [Enterococcus innesii]
MLNKLGINSFKSIRNMELDLTNLNLFVGTNSSGKSSILQALLVLSQSIDGQYALNGPWVQLGTFNEVRNTGSREDIKIIAQMNDCQLTLTIDEDEKVFVSNDSNIEQENMNYLHYRNKKIHYISANRISGMDLYPRNMDSFDDFGIDGRYSIDYLFNHKSDIIDKDLIIDSDALTLQYQLNFWLKKIMNIQVNVNEVPQTDVIKLEYKNELSDAPNLSGKYSRPKNVGSGNSYIISIIIMCLASNKEDILVIENPELHLHPKAQSKLSEFLFHIAKNGRQLFIETHSDHVFNATRVEISKEKHFKDLVSINFISLNKNYETINQEIVVGEGGEVLNPKEDLFDQFENDLLKMIGL